MWLGRVVRGVLRVEGLGVLPLEGGAERRAGARAAAAAAAAAPAAAPPGRNGGAALGPEEGGGTGAAPQRTHAALLQQVCAQGARSVRWGSWGAGDTLACGWRLIAVWVRVKREETVWSHGTLLW